MASFASQGLISEDDVESYLQVVEKMQKEMAFTAAITMFVCRGFRPTSGLKTLPPIQVAHDSSFSDAVSTANLAMGGSGASGSGQKLAPATESAPSPLPSLESPEKGDEFQTGLQNTQNLPPSPPPVQLPPEVEHMSDKVQKSERHFPPQSPGAGVSDSEAPDLASSAIKQPLEPQQANGGDMKGSDFGKASGGVLGSMSFFRGSGNGESINNAEHIANEGVVTFGA